MDYAYNRLDRSLICNKPSTILEYLVIGDIDGSINYVYNQIINFIEMSIRIDDDYIYNKDYKKLIDELISISSEGVSPIAKLFLDYCQILEFRGRGKHALSLIEKVWDFR